MQKYEKSGKCKRYIYIYIYDNVFPPSSFNVPVCTSAATHFQPGI